MEKIKDSVILILIIAGAVIFVFQFLSGLLALPGELYKLMKLLLPIGVFIFIIYLISSIFNKK